MATNKPINSVFIFKAGTSEKIKQTEENKKKIAEMRKQGQLFRKHLGK